MMTSIAIKPAEAPAVGTPQRTLWDLVETCEQKLLADKMELYKRDVSDPKATAARRISSLCSSLKALAHAKDVYNVGTFTDTQARADVELVKTLCGDDTVKAHEAVGLVHVAVSKAIDMVPYDRHATRLHLTAYLLAIYH